MTVVVPVLVALVVLTASEAPVQADSHHRMVTANGPVHVWTPTGYDAATAGIVVYVHGYFANVDRAWREHRLAAQFAASGLNAMFIACEAPAAPGQGVHWPSVGSLLDTVGARHALPDGAIAAIGHSAAHRTLVGWLREDLISTVVLVDALYGDMPELRDWLDADAERRLVNAAALTRRWSDALHADIPDTVRYERFPTARRALRAARAARVVYVHSQLDHMTLVTGGTALPMLLGTLRMASVNAR